MKIMIIVNKGEQTLHYNNVLSTLVQHQRNNGNWLIIYFEPGTPEFEEYKNQGGVLPISIDLRYDQILTY